VDWVCVSVERRVADADSCEHSNKHSGSINDREFLDPLSNYQVFKKVSASWNLLVV
jgi:hypothetical protein